MPFDYYRRLSAADKATYRASDRIGTLPLPAPGALVPFADEVRYALEAEERIRAQRASAGLANALLAQLGHERLTVRVLSVRPSLHDGELHGFYEHIEGQRPVIRVWMRTAVHRRPVAYRTFLRTLLHEVCHHLDYVHLGLADSFHTEGFFQREAHLARRLLGPSERAPRKERRRERAGPAPRRAEQLELVLSTTTGRSRDQ